MERHSDYVKFTKEMKKDYTILAPNMLPIHFKFVLQILNNEGYKTELLETYGDDIIQTGLKYTHNDACYPAILVIGQFISAIQSGKYDLHKTALIMFQTGGGCRASNYIFLIRKALERAGYGYIPVISFSLVGLEEHPGFKLSLTVLRKMFFALIYGDIIMSLVNQCKPYEINKGESEKLAKKWTDTLADEMQNQKITFSRCKKRCLDILNSFGEIRRNTQQKVKVGIVGEIYVKFSPLGNNHLEQLLVDNDAEVVLAGLYDFMVFIISNRINDYKDQHRGNFLLYRLVKLAYSILIKNQKEIIALIDKHGVFRSQTAFNQTLEAVKPYINLGCKMGEGWLLPAEILELANSGINNIVCVQPFGCLPNHIVGKGMMKSIKEKNPNINIIAVDYDASESHVNQENRIKLMLSNAKDSIKESEKI